MTPAQLLADPWAFGPWCWIVGEVRLLPTPIPCRGMQGLWPNQGIDPRRAFVDAGIPIPQSALTLQQPYATAIALGPKRVENRPWRRTIPPGGLWVGLHAGKGLYSRASLLVRCWTAREEVEHGEPFGLWPECPPLENMPRGAMLGAMHIRSIERYPDDGPLFGGAP